MTTQQLPDMDFVWVVPRATLFVDGRTPHGFVARGAPDFDATWIDSCEQDGFFVERPAAEKNPAWKQVIPYCLLLTPTGLFTVERLRRGGEARLHGMLSVGLGGHIEPGDRVPQGVQDSLVFRAARRELHEELVLEEDLSFELLGLVNDDSNAVGSVHVGIVLLAQLSKLPEVREKDRLRATTTPLVDLGAVCHAASHFESWSAFVLASTDWTASIMKIE